MVRERSRRRLLQLSGCAICALSGCSGVADRLTNEASDPNANSPQTPTTNPTGASEGTPGTGGTSTDAGPGTPTGEQTTTRSETPSQSTNIESPDTSFDDVPIPDSPGDHRYAVMGRSDADTTATVFGNWKCPYTRAFVVDHLDDVVDRYVRTGDVAVRFRSLAYRSDEPFLGPDAPRAARAGLGVWSTDPASYWSYFAYVFENQPPEREAWATTERLLSFASAAGVDYVDGTRRGIVSDEYEDRVRSTADDASALGVFSVPRVEVDGDVTAPTVDPESTREQFDRAAGR